MSLPLIIAINGILTGQASLSWPDRFDAWCECEQVRAKVLKKEYLAGPFPLWNVHVKNRILARGIAEEVDLLCGKEPRDIHFVAHSNGTDIALKAVQCLAHRFNRNTRTLVVLGSVLRPELTRNGVAGLLSGWHLNRAVCYWSAHDLALRFGRWSLGYSDLGRSGWRYEGRPVSEFLRFAPHQDLTRCTLGDCYSRDFTAEGFGHSSYFSDAHRDRIFQQIRKDMTL